MPSRLRVLILGAAETDASELRRRLEGRADVEIAGERILRSAGTMPAVDPSIAAVVLTPAAMARMRADPPAAPRARRDGDMPLVETLTPRERDVLALVADGLGNREVAQALAISEHTVKFHLASIFGKLGASSRTEAVQRGLRLGLIEI